MLKILRNRDYFMLWSGQTISLVGDGIRDWALIFWIFKASGQSPVVQSASLMAGMLPTVLLAPFSGVLVDRWDRRRIMIISDVIRFFLGLLMIPVVLSGQYWFAIAIVAASSAVSQFFDPARGAMIPRVVGPDQLVAASSLGQTTRTLLQLAGPALGTGIYMTLGPAVSFTIDAISFLISAVAITFVRTSGAVTQSGNSRPSFIAEFKAGLRYCMGVLPIRAIIIGFSILFLSFGAVNTLNLFVFRDLGINQEYMAPFAMLQAASTLAISVLVGSAAGKLNRVPMFIPAGMGLTAVGLGVLASAWNLWPLLVATVLFGVGMGVLNIGVSVTLQTVVPDAMRGRVYGTVNPLPMASMVIGAAVTGQLAQTMRSQSILGWATLLSIPAVLYLYFSFRNVQLPREQAPAQTNA